MGIAASWIPFALGGIIVAVGIFAVARIIAVIQKSGKLEEKVKELEGENRQIEKQEATQALPIPHGDEHRAIFRKLRLRAQKRAEKALSRDE